MRGFFTGNGLAFASETGDETIGGAIVVGAELHTVFLVVDDQAVKVVLHVCFLIERRVER